MKEFVEKPETVPQRTPGLFCCLEERRCLKKMLCRECSTENEESARFCRECGSPLTELVELSAEKEEELHAPTEMTGERYARFLSVLWRRKGPVTMALFIVLLMSFVFAPWAFLKLDIIGFEIVSNSYSGWGLIIPRILFYLSIIPLVVSLFMIAGIGTRRRVVETHICAFFAGMIFTVWVVIFTLSKVIASLVKNVKVLTVNVSIGQIATIFLLIGFVMGIIMTTYDRGKELEEGTGET